MNKNIVLIVALAFGLGLVSNMSHAQSVTGFTDNGNGGLIIGPSASWLAKQAAINAAAEFTKAKEAFPQTLRYVRIALPDVHSFKVLVIINHGVKLPKQATTTILDKGDIWLK
jgi:hypothetical protein